MNLTPFRLDEWLERYEADCRFNLAASTGPAWRLRELVDWMNDDERERFYGASLGYQPGTGTGSLRSGLAAMYGARADEIQIVTGASEALVAMFFLASDRGGSANVVVPSPAYPPLVNIPASFGLEARRYPLRPENGFALDPEAVERLIDGNTRICLVNSPHNPTGAVASEDAIRELDVFCAERGVQFVVDEVYHPIYRGDAPRSAAEYTGATVLGDFSKAFSLAGLRTGWVVERDEARRRKLWNVRAHFSISNNFPGELLAEVAVKHRARIFDRARAVSEKNLRLLDAFFDEHGEHVEWARPSGGMTGFPRMKSSVNARPFCEAAAVAGVLLAPGDCFSFPDHFRLGFGACDEGFDEALGLLAQNLRHALAR